MAREWTPGRYRWRTRLRLILPAPLSYLVSKGKRDCGNHEMYPFVAGVEHCWHCWPGDDSAPPSLTWADDDDEPPRRPDPSPRRRRGGGSGGGGGSGVREPRRPRSPTGSGSVAAREP